jgi:hypothetical protein
MGVSDEAKNVIPLKFLRKIKNNFFFPLVNSIRGHTVYQGEEVQDYSQSAKIRARGVPRVLRREGYKRLLHRGLYTIFSSTRYVKTLSDNNYSNYFVRCDDPSSHFSTVAMKIVYVSQ